MTEENQTNDDELSVTTEETPSESSTQESTTADASAAVNVPVSGDSKASSALDAMSEAIAEASKPRQITPKADELATDDSRPRNAKGEFIAETPEQKATREAADAAALALKNETPEQKTAREAAEAAKKPDHINDPIDPAIKGRTAERMKYLIDTIKQQSVIAEQHAAMFDTITGTGASPQEFGQMVGYLRSVRSNDPKDLDMAYKVLQSELVGLAVRMGKPLYEVNLLRDATNRDLVDEVKAGTITTNRAHELALAREITKRGSAVRTQTHNATTEAQAYETAKDGAIKELDAMDKELRTKDGNEAFQARYDALMPHFKSIVQHVPPAKWKAVFKDLYDKSTAKPGVVVPASTTVVAPVKPKQMPLRPKAPAGGGTAAGGPKTALDAMNEALGL